MDELNAFKTDISLIEYAESDGYTRSRVKGKQQYAEMKNGSDTVVIRRCNDGHWEYFNRHDESDHGTIIDFVQKRTGLNIGYVRKHLRQFVGSEHSFPTAPSSIRFNRNSVKRTLRHDVQIVHSHPYLTERGIPEHIQARYPRSIGASRCRWRNAVFPHCDNIGWCGAELKNKGFTGFIKDSKRGLWRARPAGQANAVAVAESAIDALSYAALYPSLQLILISLSGTVSTDQLEMIALLPRLPIHVCTDADDVGERCARDIVGAFSRAERHRPTLGKDWNDVLQKNKG